MHNILSRQCLPLLLALLLMAHVPGTSAMEVAGVKLDETATLSDNSSLVLNGAGVRKKLFFKIYVGALYLQEKSTDASAILDSGKPSRVLMHFVYDGVSKDKITDGWNIGFAKNLPGKDHEKLKQKIQSFNALFTDTKANDKIALDYLPGKGTHVIINGDTKGVIAGQDFNKALLSIWLGKEPVTASLKDAMLGK